MSDDPTAPDHPTAAEPSAADELEVVDDGPISMERLSDYLDAGREPYDPEIEADPSWIAGVMSRVRLESRAGREIPLASSDPRSTLHITEGAVRALIREAGDSVPGAVVISCGIVGDVAEPGAVVRVEVAISALFGTAVQELADEVRRAVLDDLGRQTELVVEALDVTVRDVHQLDTDGGPR